MDASQMLAAHIDGGADLTVAGIRVPRSTASEFGIIETGPDGHRIDAFLEKPGDPPALVDSPDESFASMGNYIFSFDALVEALEADAVSETSRHDMGGDIVPMLVDKGRAQVYDFRDNAVPGSTERDCGYWRDVGTIDSYHDAHMDLVSIDPAFNLYNHHWPILTHQTQLPGAKFVEGGEAHESIVTNGCVIAGSVVDHSVLSPNVRVRQQARVESSVIMDSTVVGRGALIRRAILDKNVVVPDGAHIGVDHDHDRARGFDVSAGGVTVVGKGRLVAPP
jgi:glucose-1-phosphate adenylyltransferase